MCVQNLKFVALPVPEIIGGAQKIWAVPGYSHAPFPPKILKSFCSDGPCDLPNLQFVALSVPQIIEVLEKFGESLDSPTLHILPNF